MWSVIFLLGVLVMMVKSLREAIYAAMTAGYVYYCIPMREFFMPEAPYQAAFWAIAAVLSLRYGSSLSKWSSQEILDVSKNAITRCLDEFGPTLEQAVFTSVVRRLPEYDSERQFVAQVENPVLASIRERVPSVVRGFAEKTATALFREVRQELTSKAQDAVATLHDASESQWRSVLKQRVSPDLETIINSALERNVNEHLAVDAAVKAIEDAEEQGNDEMGDMPKPSHPIIATLKNSGFWMFVGFTLMTIVGAQLSVHRPGSAQVKVQTCILLFIPVIGILFAVRNDRHFMLFTWAWMFGVWHLSASAARKWVTYGGRIDDVGGQGGEANFLGAIIVMVAPISFSMLMNERTANLRRMGYVAAAGYVLGILACGSRGAMCAFIGQMGYWLMHTGKKAKAYALALVAVAIFIAVAPPEFMARMATIIEPKGSGFSKPKVEESKRERQLLWALAVDVFKENPVVGVGPQQYTHYSAVRLPQLTGAYSGRPGLMTHNSWLQILSEYGIIGSFFYIGGYFWSIFCFRRARKKLKDFAEQAWFRSYCLGFEAGGLGAAMAMTFSSFQWLDFIFWYIVFGPLTYAIACETRARLDWLTPLSRSAT
ncbi:MAG: O-antigen ligase family protein [Myxococcota bacterium]|nr:O-antigen ligase family protein [Myxococcota bacterium]